MACGNGTVVKKVLVDLLVDRFAVARRRYKDLIADRTKLKQILDEGASTARDTAQKTLTSVRQAVGIDLIFDQTNQKSGNKSMKV
jgi:hypothetical protein